LKCQYFDTNLPQQKYEFVPEPEEVEEAPASPGAEEGGEANDKKIFYHTENNFLTSINFPKLYILTV
jgi:hypothetical protein